MERDIMLILNCYQYMSIMTGVLQEAGTPYPLRAPPEFIPVFYGVHVAFFS